jgi:NADPH-dependent ferric siderophore reductase
VEVRRVEDVTPRLRRVTLAGRELAGLPEGLPAASVRLLLPRAGSVELPRWEGNEFRFADGTRPPIRTLTPRRAATEGVAPRDAELDVEIVLHDRGVLSDWATQVEPGARTALAGTGRGYAIEPDLTSLVLAGDETAIPAISVLLESLPAEVPVSVLVEVAHPDARLELPRAGVDVTWCDRSPDDLPGSSLVPAVEALALPPEQHVWAAGEAAAMQRIRRHLFEDRGLVRSRAVVRGYWKHGRAGDTDGE